MRKSFPKTGKDWDAIEQDLDSMAADDIDWRQGRDPLWIQFATAELHELGKKAYLKFFAENALGGKRGFYGIKRMEEEIVQMSLDLFNAPEKAAGSMSTGGTESIFLAIKACRDGFLNKSKISELNMVVPYSVHPAFDKACTTMNIEIRRVPLRKDFRADIDAMENAIDEGTIMIAGSAPCFPHGVIDPIKELSDLALKRNIWLHVDACIGGYIAPFARKLGYPVPEFDFSLAGVRSISADLHKFGFCPKLASVVLYANQNDFQYQMFDYNVWPSGQFITATLTGTRPAGSIAAAWSIFHYLGESGYLDIVNRLMKLTHKYVDGIKAIDGLHLWVEPDLSIINFGSHTVDIFAVAEEFTQKKWLPGLTQNPRGMHIMTSLIHEPVCEEYLLVLKEAVKKNHESKTSSSIKVTY